MSKRAAFFAAGLAVYATAVQAEEQSISAKVEFMFDGAKVAIAPMAVEASRHAALFAALDPSCDPYCIAPELAAPGIETLIEPDVLAFLEKGVGTNTGLLVDARMPHDRDLGFIPGSVSLPVDTVSPQSEFRRDILKALGVRVFEDVFNFADAQSLVVYDNGPTQNDAGRLIGYLLDAGYPSEKIRYYRGGMQVWSVLGLTIQE